MKSVTFLIWQTHRFSSPDFQVCSLNLPGDQSIELEGGSQTSADLEQDERYNIMIVMTVTIRPHLILLLNFQE